MALWSARISSSSVGYRWRLWSQSGHRPADMDARPVGRRPGTHSYPEGLTSRRRTAGGIRLREACTQPHRHRAEQCVPPVRVTLPVRVRTACACCRRRGFGPFLNLAQPHPGAEQALQGVSPEGVAHVVANPGMFARSRGARAESASPGPDITISTLPPPVHTVFCLRGKLLQAVS